MKFFPHWKKMWPIEKKRVFNKVKDIIPISEMQENDMNMC